MWNDIMLPSGISVLSLWVQGTTLLSIKASQGQVFLHFFLGRPQWGLQIFLRMPFRDCLCLSSKREERNWHQQELHAQTACCTYHWAKYLYMLNCPSRTKHHFFNGWKNLSLGYFPPLASQQMLLRANFASRFWAEPGQKTGCCQKATQENRAFIQHTVKENIGKHKKSVWADAVIYVLSQLISQCWYWCLFSTEERGGALHKTNPVSLEELFFLLSLWKIAYLCSKSLDLLLLHLPPVTCSSLSILARVGGSGR